MLDGAPDCGIIIMLHRNDMAMLVQVSGDKVVTSRVEKLSVPLFSGEEIDELVVLKDSGPSQPGTASQTPGPLVCDPAGSAASTTTKEVLRACQRNVRRLF